MGPTRTARKTRQENSHTRLHKRTCKENPSKENQSKYVTVTADISNRVNTYSNFICNLTEGIELIGEYEVGVSDFMYNNDFSVSVGTIIVNVPTYFNSRSNTNETVEQELQNMKESVTACQLDVNSCRDNFHAKLREYFKLDTKKDSDKCKQVMLELDQEFELFTKALEKVIRTVQIYTIFYPEVQALCSITDQLKVIYEEFNNQTDRVSEDDRSNIIRMFRVMQTTAPTILSFADNVKMRLNLQITIRDRSSSSQIAQEIHGKYPGFFFLSNSNLVVKPYIELLNMTDSLDKLFQFKNKTLFSRNRDCVQLIRHFSIFTDIISENSIFAKNEAVIRIIKPDGKEGDFISKSFDRPHYLPCNKTFINKISIQIKDNTSNFIQFNTGPVILKLHFKSCTR